MRSSSNIGIFTLYDTVYHEPYQPEMLTKNATKLAGIIVDIAPGIEYLESIYLVSEESEQTEREEVYFVLESAHASSEKGAAKNIVICHDNKIIVHINLVEEGEGAISQFQEAISKLISSN